MLKGFVQVVHMMRDTIGLGVKQQAMQVQFAARCGVYSVARFHPDFE